MLISLKLEYINSRALSILVVAYKLKEFFKFKKK